MKKTDEERKFKKGIDYFNQQQYKNAISCFEKVISINKNHFEAYINLAACFMNSHKLEKAVEIYLMAIDKKLSFSKSKSYYVYSLMADPLTKLEQFDKAILAAQKSIKLNPIKTDGYIALSRINAEKGNDSLANRYLIFAAKLGNTGVQSYLTDKNVDWGRSKLTLIPNVLYEMSEDQMKFIADFLGVDKIF